MQKFLILLIMMVCLFGPMTIFVVMGKKALEELGRRPSEGSRVMIPFLVKLVGATAVSIGLLMLLLKFFAPSSNEELNLQYRDAKWQIEQK